MRSAAWFAIPRRVFFGIRVGKFPFVIYLANVPCLWFGPQTATELVEQYRIGAAPTAMTWYTPEIVRGSISAPKPLCPILD